METSEMLYEEPVPGMYVRSIYKTVPFDPTGQTPEQWKAARDTRLVPQTTRVGEPAARGGGAVTPNAAPRVNNGLTGDPHPSTKEIGKVVAELGISNTLAEIEEGHLRRGG